MIHNEFRLKQALALANVGSWELDYATGVATLSAEALRIYGLLPGESEQTYETWLSFVHPEDVNQVLKLIGNGFSVTNPTLSHRIVLGDQTVKHVYSQVYTLHNTEGVACGLYGITHDVTGIRTIETALRESEANLKAIFESSSDGFILANSEGVVVAFNKKSYDIIFLNIEKHLKVGDSIFDYVHASRKDAYKDTLSRVLAGETLQYDYSFKRKSGKTHWFQFSIHPVKNEDGNMSLSIGSVEITERKNAEELLRQSQSNLEAIIENTDSFIYSLDTNLNYITFNTALRKSFKELYDITLETGYHVLDFVRKYEPELEKEWRDTYTRALNGEIIKFERSFITGDICSHIAFSIHPIWQNKQVIGLSCFVSDITNEKIAKLALKQSELRYRQIVETAQEGIWRIGADGITSFVNQKMCEILGYTCDEMLGKHIYDFINKKGKEVVLGMLDRQTVHLVNNFLLITKSGKQIHCSVSSNPVFDDSGVYDGTLAMLSDVTEKVMAEKANDAKAKSLKKLNEQLEAHTRELVISNKELEQFSYIVSHNLRSPLANIMGMVEELKHESHRPEIKEMLLEQLSSSVTRMDNTIKDLNQVLKVKKGFTEKREQVDLSVLIADVRVSIGEQFQQQQVCLATNFAQVSFMHSIKSYLYSIFYNLITNSIKYKQPGVAPVIEITSIQEEGDIVILFKDNGMGIDLLRKRNEVFGLYKRFHTHIEGKGLGLFMVKTQVELLGGKVSIESEINKGTVFTLRFKGTK